MQLVADEAFLDVLVLRDIATVLHPLVEVIPRKEPSGESLNRQYAVKQVLFHPFRIGFLIIILLSADGAAFFVALGLLEALEAFQASLVEDVGATEDGLLLQPQVLIAYRARLLLIEPLESLLLDILPLVLA